MENLSCVIVSLLFIGLGSIVKTQGDIAPNYDFGTYKILEPKQSLVLQCNVTGTEQKYTLKWFKEDQPIVVDDKEKRIQIIDEEHKLVIAKPTEDDIGNYTCRVNHGSINTSSVDFNATINVVGRPTARMPPTMSLVEGETLVLDCVVNGKPVPEVVWKFGNISINETSGRYELRDERGVPNSVLSIKEVIMDDRGVYTCLAHNVANQTETSTFVRVKGHSANLEGIPPEVKEKRSGCKNHLERVNMLHEEYQARIPTLNSFEEGEDCILELRKKAAEIEMKCKEAQLEALQIEVEIKKMQLKYEQEKFKKLMEE